MTLTELLKEAHDNSKKHGFWEGEQNLAEKLALIHSEVSEALEELRQPEVNMLSYSDGGKPEGLLSELADVMIRVGDLAEHLSGGITFENVVQAKMAYNRTRPVKHGKMF